MCFALTLSHLEDLSVLESTEEPENIIFSLVRCLVMCAVCLTFTKERKTSKDQQMISGFICMIVLKVICVACHL